MPQDLLDPFDPSSEEGRFPIGHGTVSSEERLIFMSKIPGQVTAPKGRREWRLSRIPTTF
jgi:hypothetical protein